ncbi:hypothetical protein B0H13DRAFT_2004624 [Mycena leptocephala]|nr:hypothetical protein B0H13DRAFT_2004624 [Mycena leptocephala]
MRFTLTLASLALLVGVSAQTHLLCTEGGCWNSPANATDHGCSNWAGGVDADATCGFDDAVTCTTCLPCIAHGNSTVGGCYTSPDQLFGTGCTAFNGGTGAWADCGFEGALTCNSCPSY